MKRIRELSLSFEHDGKPRGWTVLIGENGTAKTTILQAIALACAGSYFAGGLPKAVDALRDRRDAGTMEIDATFEVHDGGEAFEMAFETGLRLAPKSLVMMPALAPPYETSMNGRVPPRNTPAGDILSAVHGQTEPAPDYFAIGYGISRALPDPTLTPPLNHPAIDRLRPLFDAQSTLQATAFANHFVDRDRATGRKRGETSRRFAKLLKEALTLGGDGFFPKINDVDLRGSGGVTSASDLISTDRFTQKFGRNERKIPGSSLSHGYQSTFAWVADLIGHYMLEAGEDVKATQDLRGLVLIDELDLYLHPTWQASFVGALKRIFPNMQFVATTHSPVLLSGLAPHEIVRLGVDEESGDVVRLAYDDDGEWSESTSEEPSQPDPRMMTGGELYRTWFGLDRLTPNAAGEDLRRFAFLAADPSRTEEEEEERKGLEKQLTERGIGDLPTVLKRTDER